MEMAVGLEHIELMLDVERAFDIEIPDEAMNQVRTAGEFYDVVAQVIRAQRVHMFDEPDFEDELWDAIRHFATRNGYSSEPDRVMRDTRFVEDLGYG